MGLLTDFFIATEAQASGLTEESLPSDSFDTFQAKGVDTVKVDLIYAALSGRPFDEVLNCGKLIRAFEPEGPWILRLPPELVAALASLESSRRLAIADELSGIEDFEGASIADISSLLEELAAIASRVQPTDGLYHWICL